MLSIYSETKEYEYVNIWSPDGEFASVSSGIATMSAGSFDDGSVACWGD